MPRYLVLDWDHQQLQIVAANVRNKGVRIEQAVVWDVPHSPNPAQAEELGQALRQRLKAAEIAPAPLVVCVGRDRVILKDLRFPAVAAAEEPAMVRFQAVKELNDPASEVIIDYAARPGGSQTERRALAVVLRRELLTTYQALAKAAGLKLAGICPRPFGAAGSVHHAGTTDTVAVLTGADRWAEFCVVRGETLLLARTLTLPGSDEALLGEIRRNLAVFAGQAGQEPVRALYVADGTTAGTLQKRLADRLAIPVHELDPLNGLASPPNGRGVFAGAVGVLHLLAAGSLPINFVNPRDVKPVADPNRRKAILAGSLVAALLLAGVALGWTSLAGKERQLNELLRQKAAMDQQLAVLKEDEKRIKTIADWVDTDVVWLDELYDIADRVPDINAMRITGITVQPLRKTGNDKHVAKVSITGISTDNYDAVDNFIRQFVRDGAYKVAPKKMSRNNTGIDRTLFSQQFVAEMEVEPQPTSKYVRRLPPPPPPQKGRPAPAPKPPAEAADLEAGAEGGQP